MSNFKLLLNDVLLEKEKTIKDLETAGVIFERAFYEYKNYTPFLPTIIRIVNYLEVSLDYLSGRTTINNFRKYKENQTNFYSNIIKILKENNISQSKLCKEVQIGRPNFTYWKNGKLPKFSTLIELANYLGCNIDDFLDFEDNK